MSSSACMAWAKCSTSSCWPITPERSAGSMLRSAAIAIFSPISCAVCSAASAAGRAGSTPWAGRALEVRAGGLERAGDLLGGWRARLIALLQAEGGQTLYDAVAGVREAIDFCRYYALEARRTLAPR